MPLIEIMSLGFEDMPQQFIRPLQDKRESFMALLGTCITEWAWVEEQVYSICQMILGTAAQHTSIIFYRTPTLSSRLDLANELMATVFPKPSSGKHSHLNAGLWSKLLSDIKSELPIRNRLAHSPAAAGVYGILDEETGEVSKIVEVKMGSSPLAYESWRPEGTVKEPLHEPELESHLKKLRELHHRLRTYASESLPQHVKSAFPQNFAK